MNRGRRPVYLDQAATTFPKPRAVQQAVDQAVRRWGANPGHSGHTLAVETARRVYQCREEAAALFGCQPEGIIFTKNCTEAINLAIWGTMRPGGHLIISDLEHNAVARVAQALEDRGIAQYDVARVYPEDDLRTVYPAHRLHPRLQRLWLPAAGGTDRRPGPRAGHPHAGGRRPDGGPAAAGPFPHGGGLPLRAGT